MEVFFGQEIIFDVLQTSFKEDSPLLTPQIFNQEFAEFLRTTNKPMLELFEKWGKIGDYDEITDPCNIFAVMSRLYTGKDVSRIPPETIEIAKEILAELGF